LQSWGTKGSDKVSEDLGVVKSHSDNKNEVTVDLPLEQQDINAVYRAELQTLAEKPAKEVTVVSGDQKQEDYYKVRRSLPELPGAVLIAMKCAEFQNKRVTGLDYEQCGSGWCYIVS